MFLHRKKAVATEDELSLIEPRKQFELAEIIQRQIVNFEIKIDLLKEFSEFFKAYVMLLRNADKVLFEKAVDALQIDKLRLPFEIQANKPPLRYVGMEMW